MLPGIIGDPDCAYPDNPGRLSDLGTDCLENDKEASPIPDMAMGGEAAVLMGMDGEWPILASCAWVNDRPD
jgi:hypothetical protein